MAAHGAFESARSDAQDYGMIARSALHDMPEHPLREILGDLIDYVLNRLH
jgi:octaprenyl-diphosphate synthase